MRTVAIIQARMQSTRLANKVLADIQGKPMLGRVLDRVRRAATLDAVVVATTTESADDAVVRFCRQSEIDCFRGSQNDVLDRYHHAARAFDAGIVVRLTADCPLLDPQVIDLVVRTFVRGDFDFVSNTIEYSYPNGLDTEVFSLAALAKASREARLKSQREHVTSYITDHPELFRRGNVRADTDHSAMRWTVDEPQDLEFVRKVYSGCGPGPFGTEDVLELLRDRPHLARINDRFERNEGYAKSLREDCVVGGVENR